MPNMYSQQFSICNNNNNSNNNNKNKNNKCGSSLFASRREICYYQQKVRRVANVHDKWGTTTMSKIEGK